MKTRLLATTLLLTAIYASGSDEMRLAKELGWPDWRGPFHRSGIDGGHQLVDNREQAKLLWELPEQHGCNATPAPRVTEPWPTDVPRWQPVKPGEHARLLFRRHDLPALRKRAATPEAKGDTVIIGRRTLSLDGDNLVLGEPE